eukprot:15435513-Alexandrium_andersonii.AAC.1
MGGNRPPGSTVSGASGAPDAPIAGVPGAVAPWQEPRRATQQPPQQLRNMLEAMRCSLGHCVHSTGEPIAQ